MALLYIQSWMHDIRWISAINTDFNKMDFNTTYYGPTYEYVMEL